MEDLSLKDSQAILEKSSKDSLTRFFLRETFNPFIEKLIEETRAQKKIFSIAIVDIDHFKKFNDKYGHLFGDEVLKYMASTLRLTLQDSGHIFRYGGDEFVVIFPNKDQDLAYNFMRRCNHCVANRPFSYKGKLTVVTISCGVASFPHDATTREKLVKRADEALYFSKHYGRNSTTLASKMIYIKLRRFLLFAIGFSVVLGFMFISSRYVFKDYIKSTINKFKRIKVVEQEPKELDVITLKRGREIRGYIIEDKDNFIVVSMELDKGKGTLLIERKEIAHIQYGSKTPPQDAQHSEAK